MLQKAPFLSSEVVEKTPASVCFEQICAAEFTSMRIDFSLFVCHPSGRFAVSLWIFVPPHSHFVFALISDGESEGLGELGEGRENAVFTCICVLIWFLSCT